MVVRFSARQDSEVRNAHDLVWMRIRKNPIMDTDYWTTTRLSREEYPALVYQRAFLPCDIRVETAI